MKILYIANALMPAERAHSFQIMKTCEAFVKASSEVELVLPWRFNLRKSSVFDYYGLKTKFKIVKIPSFDLIPLFDKAGFWIQSLSFTGFAFFYGIFKKCDIVYSREIAICFLLSLFGKKVVFEDHEPKKSKEWLYKFFLKKIKKKVVVAFNIVDIYKKFGIAKNSYTVAPNGFDLDEFSRIKPNRAIWQKDFNIDPESKTILYVGHFYKWKGVHTLIDSADLLNFDAKVVLIGGTKEDFQQMTEYVNGKKIGNVFMCCFVLHSEVIKYIKSADILVLPNTAKKEHSSKYTTPIKLFEYMASGVPIVASRLESFSRYLTDGFNALLFEPDNPSSLAEKINFLLDNKELGEKLAQKARMQSKKYTWGKRVEKILNFIQI